MKNLCIKRPKNKPIYWKKYILTGEKKQFYWNKRKQASESPLLLEDGSKMRKRFIIEISKKI